MRAFQEAARLGVFGGLWLLLAICFISKQRAA
jgi:hypothetical protein